MSRILLPGILQQTKNRLPIIWQGLEYYPVVGAGGATWLDRNLGATRVATSINDTAAFGGLFQWGRFSDGHEVSNSQTTTTQATTPLPNLGNSWDGKFIIDTSVPYLWTTTTYTYLWQGVNGTNNPCPPGYRVPTDNEWLTEGNAWSTQDNAGAFASPLKIPVSGERAGTNGVFYSSWSRFWCSTMVNASIADFFFIANSISVNGYFTGFGYSVRCICDAC